MEKIAEGHVISDTELYQLKLDGSDWQYLQLNGERLIWTSDLESLKNFVENCVQQQAKWTSPGGNNNQFKSCNDKLVITWYFKKQLTLVFQGQDGRFLKEKLFKLVQDKLKCWNHIYNSTDPNQMWLQWKCSFLSIVNKHAPLRTMRVRTRSSPWITSGLKKRMHDRDILKIKASKSNDSNDWSLFKNNAI